MGLSLENASLEIQQPQAAFPATPVRVGPPGLLVHPLPTRDTVQPPGLASVEVWPEDFWCTDFLM